MRTKEEIREYRRLWARAKYRNNPELARQKRRAYIAKKKAEDPTFIVRQREYNRLACKGSYARFGAEYRKRKRLELREQMLVAYGSKCVCCGESNVEFLTIDHILDNGAEKRRNGEFSGNGLYQQLRRAGWPKNEHELSCFNCNLGRAKHNGICPHKKIQLLEGQRSET